MKSRAGEAGSGRHLKGRRDDVQGEWQTGLPHSPQ